MTKSTQKLIKSAAAIALGTSVLASALVTVDTSVSAKTSCKVSHSKLVNAKSHKLIAGFKTYQFVLYKNGKEFTGIYKDKYFKSGTLFTGVSSKIYYKKGVKATATVRGVYYKKGVPFTGEKTHVFYKNGKKINGTTPNGKYYINGILANGTYTMNGVQVEYKNGKVVADKTAPIITLEEGSKTFYKIKKGKEFTAPRVTAKDILGNSVDVVSSIIDSEGKAVEKIDTTVTGTYTIIFTAKDNTTNKATALLVDVEVK